MNDSAENSRRVSGRTLGMFGTSRARELGKETPKEQPDRQEESPRVTPWAPGEESVQCQLSGGAGYGKN